MENTQKQEVLGKAIALYVQHGYRVSSQTENTAQLVKPKKFNAVAAFFLFLFFIVPFVLYLLAYIAQNDKTIYIVVDDSGTISVTDENGQTRKYDEVETIAVTRKAPTMTKEDDPGIQKNTKIILGVLVVIIVIIFTIVLVS